ncbi:Mitogen-activated protein kinase-binding protein [Schistosoma japonicum]|uniref:Mitogen-activated protein kinase-binding protein n=1 Tax=Schistosoma japonicum TaxID=6182 RepID=A0A4Z2DA63_SCHJA|nr:Mitogen-activated protein kinase-binding protein [Schistosoma japonicum]
MSKRPVRSHTISKSCRIQPNTQVTLERVIGFTLSNNCAVAFSEKTGLIAHAAGCVTVLHSFENERQQFIQSQSRKAITAMDFSSDGKYLATGESGHQPMVRLWNVSDRCQLAEFGGHHFRVVAVRFSPNDQYLVSVGSQEDHTLYVWDRQSGQRVASAKVTNRIYGVAFSPTGQFFVTVGVRYVRFWYLDNKRNKIRETLPLHGRNAILGDMFNSVFTDVCCITVSSSSSPLSSTSSTLSSSNPGSTQINSAKLKFSGDDEDLTNSNSNISINKTASSVPSVGSTVTATSTIGAVATTTLTLVVNTAGRLIQFNGQRDLDKWVDLKTSRANCISTSGGWVTVGCTTGVCLLFEAESLQFIAKLPLPHSLGSSLHLSPNIISNDVNASEPIYPDIIAIKLDRIRNRIICFYNDHSIHVWDIHDLTSINKCRSHYYHSRGIWSVDCLPEGYWQQNHSSLNHLPSWWSNDMFVTCSDDGTIRFWNLVANYQPTVNTTNNDNNRIRLSNSVPSDPEFVGPGTTFECTEQIAGVIYTDLSYKYLCNNDRSSIEITLSKLEGGIGILGGPGFVPGTNDLSQIDSALQSPVSPSRPSIGEHFQLISNLTSSLTCGATATNSSSNTSTGSTCVRTICISPDVRHLAAGDRDGSLRVYSLETLKLFCQIPAHDNEILSLNFFRSQSVPQLVLLCSASRDRMIHIFDPNKEYSRVQTISDHSGAIFSAKIIETDDGEIRLISCGMDKSLLFRILEPDESGQTAHFALEHHLVGRHSQLDAAITPMSASSYENRAISTNRKRYLAVACQDRRLRIYNVVTARPVRCYRGSYTEDGFLVRCSIDPTGSLIATSGSDKQLNLFHLLTGESISTLYGHSELCFGLRFLPNLRYLISVSADSCIFVWRLSANLTQYLRERITSSCMHKNVLGNSISYPQLDGIPLEVTTSSTTRSTIEKEDVDGGCSELLNKNLSDYFRPHSDRSKFNVKSQRYTCEHNNIECNDEDNDLNDYNALLYNNEMNEGENFDGDYCDDDDVTSCSQTMPTCEWNDSLAEYVDDDGEDIRVGIRDHGDNAEDSELDSFPLDDLLSVDNLIDPITTNISEHTNIKHNVKKRKPIVNGNDSRNLCNKNNNTVSHLSKSKICVNTTPIIQNNNISSNNNNGNNHSGKKPEFYFSVSALPAWARRKLSRRESVTIVPTSLPQVINTEIDVTGSDSASQTSVGSGPVLPASTIASYSHETVLNHVCQTSSARIPKHNHLRDKSSIENNFERKNLLTPVSDSTTTVATSVPLPVTQSTELTNTYDHHNFHSQMSRSEYNSRECSNINEFTKISSNEQIRERKGNWFSRAVSAPDTPRFCKKDATSVDIRRSIMSTGTTTMITASSTAAATKTRKMIDNSLKKVYPSQGSLESSPISRVSVQNRPKDLAIEQVTPPSHTYEVCANGLSISESISSSGCTNALPLFNRPRNKSSNQRSYSATQLVPSRSKAKLQERRHVRSRASWFPIRYIF